jgi:hypothetical protein
MIASIATGIIKHPQGFGRLLFGQPAYHSEDQNRRSHIGRFSLLSVWQTHKHAYDTLFYHLVMIAGGGLLIAYLQ